MARVVLNKFGTDIQDLTMTQNGSSETTVVLRDSLLLGDKDYHFGVTELSVPLTNTPMFGWMKKNTVLITILRRKTAIVFDNTTDFGETHAHLIEFNAQMNTADPFDATDPLSFAANIAQWNINLGAAFQNGDEADSLDVQEVILSTYTIQPILVDPSDAVFMVQPGRKFFDPLEFTRAISLFFENFVDATRKEDFLGVEHGAGLGNNIPVDLATNVWQGGIHPHFVRLQINADGRLLIRGTVFFWNNWIIKFSKTGAALLGVDFDTLTPSHLQFTRNVQGGEMVTAINPQILQGNNDMISISECAQSIFQTSENRLKVTIEGHLPQQSNIEIRDTIETSNREICQGYFLNNVTVEMQWNSLGALVDTKYRNNIYAGQHSFINKNQSTMQWNKLLSAENLSFFRFYLMIHYRAFNEATSKWSIVSERMDIPDNEYWAFTVRFVSDE